MINSHALLFMLGGIFMTHEQFEKAADYWKNKGMSICAYKWYDTAFADYHTTDKNLELCRAMSVECNISENVSLPPILMFHGTKDRTINPKVSVVVYEALKKYNKDVKLYLLEGADHGGSEFFSDNVLDIIEEFLQKIISAS